ncbi:MAG: hypothetical protein ACLVIW_08350, partial [Bilophila wadsworthia]
SQTLPTPSQDFHPYRIPLHSFSVPCKGVPLSCILKDKNGYKNDRVVSAVLPQKLGPQKKNPG